jgi:uncharacterized protein YicC (UPF0701 family)
MVKIYSDDPDLPYKTTEINALRTKAEIEGLLVRWGITKYAWDWNPPHNIVKLEFQINEKFGDSTISPMILLHCPMIWDKAGKRGKPETINWNISLRLLHWYVKNGLAWAYTSQSEKTVAFLSYVEMREGIQLKEVVKQNIEQISALPALTEQKLAHVIEIQKERILQWK